MGSQEERILERFGQTAEAFGDFVLSERSEDMRRVVAWLKPDKAALVLDVACGPGTLALAFAASVARPEESEGGVIGIDLTPEMLVRAKKEAQASGSPRCSFCRGRAEALPFADDTFDIVSCAYSFHHLAAAERVFEEMLRVTKSARGGGRVLVVDLIAPEEDDRAARNHQIEQLRDPSHTFTLKLSELCRMSSEHGGLPEWFLFDRERDFEDWMAVAGVKAGTGVYDECYELMWRSMEGDAAGFGAHWEGSRLHFVQHSAAVVTRKK
jgi:ubiquinone/menaquinone biosynthesis C-methylase UbiE